MPGEADKNFEQTVFIAIRAKCQVQSAVNGAMRRRRLSGERRVGESVEWRGGQRSAAEHVPETIFITRKKRKKKIGRRPRAKVALRLRRGGGARGGV